MSQQPEAGVEIDADQPVRRAPRRMRGPLGPGARWVITVVLAAVLAGAVVFAVTGYRHKQADDRAADNRRDAVSVAEQFALRLDTLNYKDIPAYEKRLSALLTTKMKSDFSNDFEAFAKVYQTLQFSSTGSVKAAGISDIDDDSATVLVIHDVKVSSRGCVQPPYKRTTVDLRKVQGTWLVDDFAEDVPGCQG